MFDFRMSYNVSLKIKHPEVEKSHNFAIFLQNILLFPGESIKKNENDVSIAFSMSMGIKEVRTNLQNIQILVLLINKKFVENNIKEVSLSGKFIGTPIFAMNNEKINLSEMIDDKTTNDLNMIVRDNIFYKPYGTEPAFEAVINHILEKSET